MDPILFRLMNSVRDGELQKVKELIGSYGISYSRDWSEGYVLLRTAIENRRTDIAKLLLTNGARVNTKNTNPCDTPLYFAVRNRDIEIVEMLLNRSANVNAKSKKGLTPLLISVNYGNIEITKLLLNHGADNYTRDKGLLPIHIAAEKGYLHIAEDLLNHGAFVNSQCTSGWRDGYTPLHLACGSQYYQSGYDREEIVKFLLSKNADINAVAKDNLMPLYIATKNGHETIVKLLLELGANVNAEDKNGKTVLYLAVEKGLETFVELFLEHGANCDSQDEDGKTILHLAAERGNSMIIEHILKYCPDINNKGNRTSLHAAIHGSGGKYKQILGNLLKYGFTLESDDVNNCELLYDAVGGGYLTIVETLLNYGADVNMSFTYKKKTLLHRATEYHRVEVAKLLIKSGADVNAKDNAEKSPIFYATSYCSVGIAELLLTNGANVKDSCEALNTAVKNGHKKYVEMFIQCGADINTTDKDGITALHFTALNNVGFLCDITVRGEIAKLLLKGGANINAQTVTGLTTLHAAVEHGYARVVEILLNNGADVNSQQKDGLTALHIATRLGNKTVVKVLLEGGAKIASEIKECSTPLHIAAENRYMEIVKILLEFGADIDSRDKEDRTALHIACKEGCEKVVITLLEYGSNINNINIESIMSEHKYIQDYDYSSPDISDYNSDNDYHCRDNYDNYDRDDDYYDRDDDYYDYTNHYSPYGDDDYKYSQENDSDYPSGDIGEYEEVAEILHKHIVKMITANFYVSEENLCWSRTSQAVDHFAECEEETERMEDEKIGNSNVSLYDFLTEDVNQLAMHVRNENIEQVLKSADYKTKFPVYASMINNCFRKGVERKKLLEQSIAVFHSLFNSLPELPYYCTEKVVGYLNNTDLRTLIDNNSSN